MKLVCNRINLMNGINVVSKAVPNRSTMSILECILFDATKDRITLTANDMELGIETVVEGEIVERGIVALEAKFLSDIIRKLPDGDVVIESDENFRTTISCGKTKLTIGGKSGEDYSCLPQLDRSDTVLMSQMAFRDVIRKTIFSISENVDDTPGQQTMRGELLEIFGDSIRMSSLDGHRISICKIQLRDVYDTKKVIVPGKSLNEISKILPGGADDDVELFFTPNHIMFEFGETKIVSRLIDGKFFDVDKMNIKDYETKIKVNKRMFTECVDRATVLVKEGDKKPIVLNITDGNLTIEINSVLGSMKEDLDIEKTGKDLLIAFNPKFMMDAMRVIEDETVELYFVNSKAPCFIKNNSETYVYVILPVNFNTVQG